jgi:hypothetical protein
MAIRYCNSFQNGTVEEAEKRCSAEVASLTARDVIARSKSKTDKSKFFWAKLVDGAPIVNYVFDHDEDSCDTLESGHQEASKCFY